MRMNSTNILIETCVSWDVARKASALIHIELGNKGIPERSTKEREKPKQQRCVHDDKRAKKEKRSDKEDCTKLRETNDRMHLLG